MTSKYGILVPLVAQTGKASDVADFLNAGYDVVQTEPETIQWFAVQYADVSPDTFAIFDTFPSEAGRSAHLNGKVAEALMANAPKLLSSAPEVGQVDVLASKVVKLSDEKTAGLSVGVRVVFTAKPDKVDAVREFLINALPLVEAEPETSVWYAFHFTGTNTFGVVDFFSSEAGRKAHLGGKVVAGLISSVDEFMAGPPDVVKVNVLAAKVVA